MGWLCEELDDINFGEYSLFNSNCQDFALAVFKRVVYDEHHYPESRYPAAAILGIIPITGNKY